LDSLQSESKRLSQRVSAHDAARLDEYFTSVREMERRLTAAEEWTHKPKPKVTAQAPADITEERDLIGRTRLLFNLIPLILETDSTRVITVLIQGRGDVPLVEGVSIDHHNLSHHGQDEGKIAQLRRVEEAQFSALNQLLHGLKNRHENGRSLLDHTQVLFGSNLGNANAHDTRNLPMLLAGGGYRHGAHLSVGSHHNLPLSNLMVQMLQRSGMEVDRFGSSTGSSVPGLVMS
jgi:hypothetical protein